MYYFTHNNTTIDNTTVYSEISSEFDSVSSRYPVQFTEYYSGLIKKPHDGIWKQCMPDSRELEDTAQRPDPLDESLLSPVPGLIHRYPDRVVLLVSNCCPVYCRFCMRKRLVGSGVSPMGRDDLRTALDYISSHPSIHDVILSGGDPLMLDDASLSHILSGLRAIPHVAVIRIGTRIPVTLPARITADLCSMLGAFHPLYINTHFNHPDEITPESATACAMLADAGIPLGNQTVLLKGVNDSVETMRRLLTGLLKIRVKPYYLHQMDLVQGTAHFRTSVRTGLEIMRGLRGHISGLAVPHYVIDLPGGKGKVALLPDDVEIQGTTLHIRTYTGETVTYHDVTTPQE
ncbi:MAG: KamA family radical SAM protein [Desulfuromonadaceae bacterium]|nr:KamA family radical SAM protein [Desulfuromonadaceae bacterium]